MEEIKLFVLVLSRGVARILDRGFLYRLRGIFRSIAHNYEKCLAVLAQKPQMTVVEH